tara:strand:+ start:255 stop:587 length:333 start_codon:yes stop_codon:yes gene_type:complete
MTTNTYSISQTDFVLSEDGLTNVINVIHWRLNAEQTEGDDTFYASSYGTQSVTFDPDNFTDYSDVTEANCIAWVQAAMGEEQVTALETGLQANIDLQINPTNGSGTPWAA